MSEETNAAPITEAAPVRLNLGAGDSPIPGYDNSWDLKQGKKAFPLELPDNSVDEIRASHIFEHIGHHFSEKVLTQWVRVLKPGGLLKLAVPDLEIIASKYLSGEPGQYQGWLCGGQMDASDVHLSQYDWDSLSAMMRRCGLVGLHKWPGDDDCSGLEVSLNIAGYKRPESYPKTICAMSRPRLGFMDMFGCAMEALLPLGIAVYHRSGAYYGQSMTAAIISALEDGAEWVLTLDYDTVFTHDDIEDLLVFAMHAPSADALVPVQMHRMDDRVLMMPKRDGSGVVEIPLADLDVTYYPITTGHFGLSLIRASAFEKISKPWFLPHPDESGGWGKGHIDDDIHFWLEFGKAGLDAFLVPRVVVGHLEQTVLWPDRKLRKIHQPPSTWWSEHKPREVWR